MDHNEWQRIITRVGEVISNKSAYDRAQNIIHLIKSTNETFLLKPEAANDGSCYLLIFCFKDYAILKNLMIKMKDMGVMSAVMESGDVKKQEIKLTIKLVADLDTKISPYTPVFNVAPAKITRPVIMSTTDADNFRIITKYAINISPSQDKVEFRIHNNEKQNTFVISCVGVNLFDLYHFAAMISEIGPEVVHRVDYVSAGQTNPSAMYSLDVTLKHQDMGSIQATSEHADDSDWSEDESDDDGDDADDEEDDNKHSSRRSTNNHMKPKRKITKHKKSNSGSWIHGVLSRMPNFFASNNKKRHE